MLGRPVSDSAGAKNQTGHNATGLTAKQRRTLSQVLLLPNVKASTKNKVRAYLDGKLDDASAAEFEADMRKHAPDLHQDGSTSTDELPDDANSDTIVATSDIAAEDNRREK